MTEEAVVTYSRYDPAIWLEGLRKMVCWARNRTENFPKRYCLSHLPQWEAGVLIHILLIDALMHCIFAVR